MNFRKYKVLILFICLIFLIQSNPVESQFQENSVNSLILHYGTGELVHYQITEQELRRIWTKSSDIVYQFSKIIDLDSDGNLEILLVSANEGVLLLDLETGNEIWFYQYTEGGFGLSDVAIGDVTGDLNLEIVVSRLAEQQNFDLDIINYRGELLEGIPFTVQNGDRFYGADNVEIYDIDQDGKQELFVSYGSVNWNYTSKEGYFAVSQYEWNPLSEQFDFINQIGGSDYGGNTKLLILPDLIITAGWYNNPIRAFGADGELYWDHTFFNNDEIYRLADTEIRSIQDDQGNLRLFGFSQNYWSNLSMRQSVIDLSGNSLVNRKDLFNYSSIITSNSQNKVFTSMLKTVSNGTDEFSYQNIREYSIQNNQLNEKSWNGDNNQWKFVLRDFKDLLVFDILEQYYVIGSDSRGNAILGSDNQRLEFPPKLEDIAQATINKVNLSFDGVTIVEFNIVPDYLEIFIIAGFGLLLSTIFYFIYMNYRNRRFDLSFGKNWRELFKLKIEKFLTYLRENFERKQLEETFTNKTSIMEIGIKSNTRKIIPEDNDSLEVPEKPNFILKFKADSKISIIELINKDTQLAKMIKVGDIGILIEILNNYPESTEITEIIPKFEFASKPTIYKRIDKMIELGLLENLDETELFLKNKTRTIRISDAGIQLLALFYQSLKS